jgi:hypothetical protein
MNEVIITPSGNVDSDTAAFQGAQNDPSCDVITLAGESFLLGKRALRAATRLSDRVRPLVIRGIDEHRTVLKLVDMAGGAGGDCHVMAFDRCVGLTFENFTIDGNLSSFVGFGHQAHGLYINGCTDTAIANVHTKDIIMDGAYFIGQSASASDPFCERVTIRNTTHRNNNRSGLAFQGGVIGVTVDGFESNNIKNSAIDTEPTGSRQSPQQFVIRNAVIDPRGESYAISIAGQTDSAADQFVVENVNIRNGSMQVYNTRNVTLRNIQILGRKERPPLTIRGDVSGLCMDGGTYVTRDTTSQSGAITMSGHNGKYAGRISMNSVVIVCSTAQNGITAEDIDALELNECQLIGSGTNNGIHFRNVTRTNGDLSFVVRGGRISNYATGVRVRAYIDRRVHNVTTRTTMSNLITGLYVEGAPYLDDRTIDNNYDSVITPELYQ